MGVACKQIIAEVLAEAAQKDKSIVGLCSDSRDSAGMAGFFKNFPEQAIEVGIAEQNLVSISAGLAACGKRPFIMSPASFLCSRSVEQIKVDICYSYTNVKCVGISGGISYGPLGMSHHAAQDIAMVAAIPNIRFYIPSDQFLTRFLMEKMVVDNEPAYIRVGRNATEDVYEAGQTFEMDKAVTVREGKDVTIIACGEMVCRAKAAAELLSQQGVDARVLDMYCIKPVDEEAIIKASHETGHIITVEEHSIIGGLGSIVCSVVAQRSPCQVKCLGLPDEELVCGTQAELLDYYGMDAKGIADAAIELLRK